MINKYVLGTPLDIRLNFWKKGNTGGSAKVEDVPCDISGYRRSVYYKTSKGVINVEDSFCSGSTLTWQYKGIDQRITGIYTIVVILYNSDGSELIHQEFEGFGLIMPNYCNEPQPDRHIVRDAWVELYEFHPVIPEVSAITENWIVDGVDTGKVSRGNGWFAGTELTENNLTIQGTFSEIISRYGNILKKGDIYYNVNTSDVYRCESVTVSAIIQTSLWRKIANIKGKDFTYSDFTQEQIDGLMKPANDAAVIAREAAEEAISAARQAKDEADKLPGIATDLQNAIDTAASTNSEIKSNESERLKSEQKRENSESARVAAEQARASAEEARKTAENSRINKENSRINAELQRDSNESEREARENQRIAEFSNMQSTISDNLSLVNQSLDEILQSENDRVANEAERIAAEDQRMENESERDMQEQTRQQQEQTRQQEFQSAEQSRQATFAASESARDTEFQSKESQRDAAMQTISQEAQKLTELKNTDDRMKLLLGYNAARSVVNLELGVSDKYIQCASRSAVANSAFAISKPFEVEACSELLIKTGFNPSDASHSGLDLTVIAIYEEIERQRKVQKKDGSNNPLYYVVTIDESGNETVTTEETTEETGYPVYVMETYTETRYLPNNEDKFVAIPDSGYYVANIPQTCKVVISYKPGVTDTAVIVEKHGALANLISQVFGIYEHRTMVEAIVSLAARMDALESRQGLLGNAKAGNLDVIELTKCLYPTILRGHGVPAALTIPVNLPAGLPWDGVPVFIGQLYINLDATSSGLYYAKGHGSVSDWKQA